MCILHSVICLSVFPMHLIAKKKKFVFNLSQLRVCVYIYIYIYKDIFLML